MQGRYRAVVSFVGGEPIWGVCRAQPPKPDPRGLSGDRRPVQRHVRSGGTYGSRRLSAARKAQGHAAGRYRVRSLMRQHAIQACCKRKLIHTTDSRHDLPTADNLLDRQFAPEAPNRAWAADITYVRTATGWLYLAVVLDLY